MTRVTFPVAQMWGMLLKQDPALPAGFKNPELAFSFPTLLGREDGLQIAWFIYPMTLAGQSVWIGRPLAIVTASWRQEAISHPVVRQDPDEFTRLESTFPVEHPQKSTSSAVPKAEIYAAYSPLLDPYPDKPSGSAGRILSKLLEDAISPELMPYYQATAPQFLQWLLG